MDMGGWGTPVDHGGTLRGREAHRNEGEGGGAELPGRLLCTGDAEGELLFGASAGEWRGSAREREGGGVRVSGVRLDVEVS
jgi:hypothetical protein